MAAVVPDGYGVYTWPNTNGICYEGEWKGGLPNGVGVYKWPTGEVYRGHYVNGKRCVCVS